MCVCVLCDSQLLQEVQVGQTSAGQHSQIIHAEITAEHREREKWVLVSLYRHTHLYLQTQYLIICK